MRLLNKTILVFTFLFLFSPLIFAVEFRGTRSVALSEALRGAVSLNEGIYHNPASFAFSQRYSIEGQSSVLPSHKTESHPTWIFGGSVMDSHSPLVAAGLGYARKIKETAQGDFIENATHLALSKILSEKISLGFFV